MAVASGKYGNFKIGSTTVVECMNWKLGRKAAVHQYASNSTNGFKAAVAGVRSGTLSFEGKIDHASPIENFVYEGQSITFRGYIDGTNYYTIPCVVESLDVEVDFDEGDINKWSVSAVTNGAWTVPTNISSSGPS